VDATDGGSILSESLVLLGDSILDNAPYTGAEPCTTQHLQRLLPDWTVRILALDGAIMADIPSQLDDLESRASIAVLSIGGNDVLQHLDVFESRQVKSDELLHRLVRIADDFEKEYLTTARSVATQADRTVLCTIYEVQLEPWQLADLARVPLALLNDRIIRIAAQLGLEVLELRSVCTDPDDFVMQIEPSARGAAKIARAIADVALDNGGLSSGRLFSA
jgi:hypothetical protein